MTDFPRDDEKIDAFVRRNAGYYREEWKKFRDGPGFKVSFNLAACFGQVLWLAYRKLYAALLLSVVFTVGYVSLWIYVEEMKLVPGDLAEAATWLVAFLYLAIFGFLGNYWYWRRFRKIDQQAASRHSDPDGQLRFLRSKGGTSPVGASLVVVIMIAPILWAGYWVYQEYRIGLVLDAAGPLTLGEVQSNFLAFMEKPLTGRRQECVFKEIEERVRAAGDPATLDPATVELLPAHQWGQLDPVDKRILLTQAIVTKAYLVCGRPVERQTDGDASNNVAAGGAEVIAAGDPRFNVFELSNSAGDGTFASPDGTVLLSFLARDARYCRAARFSSDYTVVLACREEGGWKIEAKSHLAPGESRTATVVGGGDMKDIGQAILFLKSDADLLDEREIMEAAGKGWR